MACVRVNRSDAPLAGACLRNARLHLPPPFRRFALPVLLLMQLAGCALPAFLSFPPQSRGNQINAGELKQLVPGTSTRADVTALLGSPTTKATFDDNTWLYISQVTKPVIAGTQRVLNQQVVAISFDQRGVLKSIGHETRADALPVAVVSRSTPSPGSEASIMQQLLGNIGRFSPAGTPTSGGGSGFSAGGS
jgi:outer membrane protein assembly factor BamE (lipoprotein component of BamABCDE complex)